MIRHFVEWFRDAVPIFGVRLAILALVAAIALGGFAAVTRSKGCLFAALGTGGGALALLLLAWIRNR